MKLRQEEREKLGLSQPSPVNKEPELPWRLPRQMKQWFVPARKAAGLSGGGTVHAEVFLKDKNGTGNWHPLTFATDGAGFRKLAAMPERARMLLLDSLACLPVRGLVLREGKRKPGGRNNAQSQTFWLTARYLGPLLLAWARDGYEKKTRLYLSALKALKRSGVSDQTPEAVAAYLVERNWENAQKLNPQRFASCPGPRPYTRPRVFWKRIPQPHSLVWPQTPDVLVKGILSRANSRNVYTLTSQEIADTVPMADFRIF